MSSDASIPYCRHHTGQSEIDAVVEVLKSGWIARGPKAQAFEAACAERVGASHAISCTNGSIALELALRGIGVGPGDEVVVPSLTWVATVMAVRLVGATPVFADIDPTSLCLSAEAVERVCTDRTRAVVVVDFAGRTHDGPALRTLCDARNLTLVVDGAHAFGATHPDGAPVGADSTASVTTFSFHPAKTLTTAEGGLVTTGDPQLAERIARLRSSGLTRDFPESRGRFDFLVTEWGSNHHLSELHAALGLCQLDRLDGFLAERARLFGALRDRLEPLSGRLVLPSHPTGSAHNLFIVQLRSPGLDSGPRDRLVGRLREAGVLAHVHYPLLHRQPVFADLASTDAQLPHSVAYERSAVTLPLFPGLSDHDLDRIATILADALAAEA